MLAVIGVGQAGSNIADEASKLGFPTGAINFSKSDLDSLEHVDATLRLVGSEGVGHNRDEAIRLFSNNWESALQFVRDNFSSPSIEVIVIAFSTGGGSGSGISPILLDVLSNEIPEKVFVAMPILPDKTEVITNQLNCIHTFEELSKLDICVMPIDNEKVRGKVNAKSQLYNTINLTTIGLLDNLVSYTEKNSKNGNLDRKDLLAILSTKGIGIIAETNIHKYNEDIKFSTETVTERIQKSWQDSIFAPIEYKRVLKSGVVFDGDESFMQYLNYDSIFNKFNRMPISLFEGNYHEQRGTVITILTGMSWITTRLDEISNIIVRQQKELEQVLEESEQEEYKSSVSVSFPTQVKARPQHSTKNTKKSMTDILNKYRR